MQAISNRKHEALIAALQHLEELSLGAEFSEFETRDEHLRYLCDTYQRYHDLLSQLADCISEYESFHHHLKVHVLGPALRRVRKAGAGKEQQLTGRCWPTLMQ